MSSESTDSTFPFATAATKADGPTPLEIEVTEFFDQFRAPLLRYLGSFGLEVQDSEEIVQDVFLALFQHLRRNKPRTNLPAWIFRVGHNLALKRCQSNRRTPTGGAETLPELDPQPNPEQQAASVQHTRRLLAVVRALPEQDRRCLYLRAEGLRYREIVEVLGMSLGSVSQSLERSLARLSAVKD
ncbi:MAG: sigma-70 family RNA polymerase sigma factor [Acidobacteriota bacterium]